jgi:hypothetical protein
LIRRPKPTKLCIRCGKNETTPAYYDGDLCHGCAWLYAVEVNNGIHALGQFLRAQP